MASETLTAAQTGSKRPMRGDKWVAAAVVAVRVLLGVTFIFSGGVKLIDPAGTMYKIEDYLVAFHLTGLSPLAMAMSVMLAMLEFLLGVNALLGCYRRVTPVLLAIFMGVMTPLTLYLAIANPIADCGCFGEAIVLTNWQTFFKNLVLAALVVVLLRYNGRVKALFHRNVHSLVVLYAVFYGGVVAWVGNTYQPLLDFRPYKTGTDLRLVLDDYGVAEYEYDFVYERDGERRTFTIDNLPAEDSRWQFVERHEREVIPADGPQGVDHFTIYDGNENVTADILDEEGYVFILFSPDIERADDDDVNKVNELYDYCREYGYPFYAVSASSPQANERWLDDTGGEYSFYFMDKITIRTIARNNPYVVALKDGVIYRKSVLALLPDEHQLNAPAHLTEWPGKLIPYDATPRVWALIAGLVLPLALLFATEKAALFVVNSVQKYYRRRRDERRARRAAGAASESERNV